MDLFVQHPERILEVAAVLAVSELIVAHGWRRSRKIGDHGLMLAAVAWLLFALWELLILATSPEANIRVDLLLIVPLVPIATVIRIVLEIRRSQRASASS